MHNKLQMVIDFISNGLLFFSVHEHDFIKGILVNRHAKQKLYLLLPFVLSRYR